MDDNDIQEAKIKIKDIEVIEEPAKNFRCPSCRYRGKPVYLAARGKHPDPKVKDYSDTPLCPYCLNQAMWRMSTQMVED